MRQTVVLWIVAIVVCARPGTAQQTRPAEAVYQNIEVLCVACPRQRSSP